MTTNKENTIDVEKLAMFRERSHVIHDAMNRMYTLDREWADTYFQGFDTHDAMKRVDELEQKEAGNG